MRWQDIRVPPFDIGHLSFSNLFLWGNQCQLGGCLDSRLLCCLGNLILEPFQLSLVEFHINAGQTKIKVRSSRFEHTVYF